ncbi:MAG TPA: CHAT domain-containing protein [Candidatus Acidoferrum sp.]|nr:CHAT domain-containing protein [Candidatus Acidoferrum sp.]
MGSRKIPSEKLFSQLAGTTGEAERKRLLARHRSLISPAIVKRLAEMVVTSVRVDTHRALALADSALEIAKRLRQKEAIALGMRARANALYASGDNQAAIEHHEKAIRLYTSLGIWKEAGRTLSSSIQPLILLGEYDRALQAFERAQEIFVRVNDPWRLARLEINAGNIFHRQDRFDEALEYYERAYRGLTPYQDTEGIAVVLGNMAVCLISLNDFPRALATYEKARRVSEENNMPLLVAQADYNIAYLYYLRGEYSAAIERLYGARRACEMTGDAYHFALCHLDLSDVYLELNLSEEAREMAHEGFQRFEELGMRYEAAKTLANEATAYGQQGRTVQALELFAKAREMFAKEKNPVWPFLVDLYQALLLFHEGRHFEARRLCRVACGFFDDSLLYGKALLSHLLLARIALQLGEYEEAQHETDECLSRLSAARAPILAHQIHLLAGQLAHRRGDFAAAYSACREARRSLESLRSNIHSEELKISFARNRLQVYEALLDLYLDEIAGETPAEEALEYIEAAKSRSMSEMIFQSGQILPMGESGQSELVRRIRELREDLNWYYHRIELEQLQTENASRKRIERLHEHAQSREDELLRTLREMPAHERENATLEASGDFSAAVLQRNIPEDCALVEYFTAGERVIAAVVTKKGIEIQPVSVVSRVVHHLHLLRFQLAKFSMGSEYIQRFMEPLRKTTEGHLEGLYSELIAPIQPLLSGRHLVIVPHGPLHFLPFHALHHAGEYLCDSYEISYAPSATIFALCQEKTASTKSASLVLGVPDQRAPEILQEVESVATILPDSKLLLDAEASSAALRERGGEAGVLHIATHGVYRQDNPMFSGIRLGDGYLNLYDLYQMRLPARLVTLSGCATGMNVVAAGDELLGLQRGLFCAGATTLLLSLWDVHDKSTAELMSHFYKQYVRSKNAAVALRHSMLELRSRYPHPYYWAPFVLFGKLTENKSIN